jgi:hypothetical protein
MSYNDPYSGVAFVVAILLVAIFATLFPEDKPK